MKNCLRIVAIISMSRFHPVLIGFNHEEVSTFSIDILFLHFIKYWHFWFLVIYFFPLRFSIIHAETLFFIVTFHGLEHIEHMKPLMARSNL